MKKISDTLAKPSTLWGRVQERLSSTQWLCWLSIWAPISAILLVSKAARISGLEESVGLLGFVELIRSEFLVALGLGVFGYVLFARATSERAFKWSMAVFQVAAASFVIPNMIGHHFYVVTGSPMTWEVFTFGVANLGDLYQVLESEVSQVQLGALAVLQLYFLLGPPVFLMKRRARSAPMSSGVLADGKGVAPKHFALGLLVVVALFLGAFIPQNSKKLSHSFVREPLLNLAAGFFSPPVARTVDHYPPLFDVSSIALKPAAQKTASKEAETPRNVVFILLESTRIDATTPYNPKLKTTPFLAKLAEESLVFDQAYAVIPHTSKALVAIFCGIPPIPTMPILEALPGALPGKCLPDLLGAEGYDTAFFQAATETFEKRHPLTDALGFDDFFPVESMQTRGYELANYFGLEDEVMLPSSEKWLRERKRPFLSAYLTLVTHHDYRPISRYPQQEFDENELANRYLNAVHYTDHFVEKLFAQYKKLGLYESTIFVILADHGEAFGEHGRFQHDNVIYQEGVHIPLLIHDPQRARDARRISTRVSQLDLVPTLAPMLGYEIVDADLPGMSAFEAPARRPFFVSCWYTNRCIGLIDEDFKYVHHYQNEPDELFDLVADPAEKNNLADAHPDRVNAWRDQVLDWKYRVFDMHERR